MLTGGVGHLNMYVCQNSLNSTLKRVNFTACKLKKLRNKNHVVAIIKIKSIKFKDF